MLTYLGRHNLYFTERAGETSSTASSCKCLGDLHILLADARQRFASHRLLVRCDLRLCHQGL
jgi:hypothetical protein